MLTLQALGDAVEIVNDFVLRERAADVPRNMARKLTIGSAKEKIGPAAPKAVPVHRDDHVAMINERGKSIRLGRVDSRRGDVLTHTSGLQHAVERRSGLGRCFGGDLVGVALEVAAVEGAEADSTAQVKSFDDARTFQQVAKGDGFVGHLLKKPAVGDQDFETRRFFPNV